MGSHDDELRDVLSGIWETLFDRSLEPGAGSELGQAPMVAGYVSIEGTWQGGVLIEMPVTLANELTRQILTMNDVPASEQMCDAVGELCNIVAGNFKALVPGPSHLSLPVVTLGSDYHVRVIGAQSASVLPLADRGNGFLVTVHEGPGPI